MRSFDHDVAIVGGGPAGASTALHLVRDQGIRADRIVLLDKARFPRDKPCAGAVSQVGVDALRALGVSLDVPFVPIRGVRVTWKGTVGETACAMGIVVRRIEFDAHLVGEARADGVVVRDGEALSDIEAIAGGSRLRTSAGVLTARLVAGCDGAGSVTRRLLGLREPGRKGHLYVLDTPETPSDEATARGFIDFDLSVVEDGLQGYTWEFPTLIDGARYVSRGIYHANLAPGAEVKASLARALARRGIDIASVVLRPFATRPFVAGGALARGGVILVGEAAGIDRATGEGIGQAIIMGAIAARHLARSLRTGGACFDGYARAVHASTMGRHMLQSARLARHVYGAAGHPARRLLLESPFAREAAMRWYNGQALPWSTKVRLAAGLASRAFVGRQS